MNKNKLLNVLIVYIVLLITVTVALKYSDASICIIKRVTGLSCPACGNTRSIIAIINGNYFLPIRFNLMFYPEVVITVLTILYFSYIYIFEKTASKFALPSVLIAIVLFVAWGVIRNIINI